ncbi:Crp/Fnr family transcriptional regulator [uncultured Algibacter sp.]|uniref:Crp/Fnr family transcriptional regulator n=1 Tax=uncultured Algibacter sp. TaxID=298659 RepID=UPI002623411F|nr:Crp/Fnr family transcriptional regulator [uncultured Algibacter sp.]
MNPDLIAYIKRFVDISNEEIDIFNSYLKPKELSRKAFLLNEGQVCKSRYFVNSGCVRLYYINNKGNEQIIHFAIDNWWITDYESLINKTPSKLYIQAIEKTSLYELPEESFDALCEEVLNAERLFRKIMEKTYVAIQKRIEYIYSLSGEQLFETFISANPEFTQRVPQYMIASYLGMSPEFISKIKSKK